MKILPLLLFFVAGQLDVYSDELSDPRFGEVDGANVRAIYLDIPQSTDYILAKFCPIADRGADIERRTADGQIRWRVTLAGIYYNHSAFRQFVELYVPRFTPQGETSPRNVYDFIDVQINIGGGTYRYARLKIETGEIVSNKVHEIHAKGEQREALKP